MTINLHSFTGKEILYFFPNGIGAQTVVSKSAQFGDDVWSFSDPENPRLNNYSEAALSISWKGDKNAAYAALPWATIQVVKLFAFLYLHAPAVVCSRRKGNSRTHPYTVCQLVKLLLAFLAHVHEKSLLTGGSLPRTKSLYDVSVRHLRESLRDWNSGRGKDLRRALTGLVSSAIQETCGGFAPRWTPTDIRSLGFKESEARYDYNPVFPNPLFRLISNTATDDVAGFLNLVGETSCSNVPGVIPPIFANLDVPAIFQTYIEYRERDYAQKHSRVKVTKGNGFQAKKNQLEGLGCKAGEVLQYIRRVHEASCSLIALYTGARYSDLTGFKSGCLQRIRGMWFLVGTHIKHEDIDNPTDQDLWPAIPAMRDALRCLELFTTFTKNHFLISGLNTVGEGCGRAYSPNGLAQALVRYIGRIDEGGTWVEIQVSPHRCRHTLGHQLARADLGLPFIAHQLKHLHSALRAVPPQVTLMYGGIADLKFERATQAPQLHFELAKSLYDPDSPLAGGGSEEFSQRRKQYFEGMQASGMTKDEIIQGLATKAIPFSSVGMGYCLGRREIKNKDGSTQKPACTGSLQCSPESCPNALITKQHAHLWKRVDRQNAELAERPEMRHARIELLEKSKRAKVILKQLGHE
jgi:hypothetical protein